MENATKALIMAGGILLALLVIGALIMLFSNLSSHQEQNDASRKTAQIAEFNNQFEPYNKDNLTLMELKSIYNKIESNNKNSDYKIEHNIDESILDGVDANKDKKIDNEDNISNLFFKDDTFNKISKEQKSNRRLICTKVEYNNEAGRISKMEFDDKTSTD